MSIKSFIRIISIGGIVILGLYLGGVVGLRYALNQVQAASDSQLTSLALSRETADNSFGLTATVRSYVASGEGAFKDAYFRILAVRAGQIPRPAEAAVAPGRQVELDRLYDEAGFTAEEKSLLAEANRLSGQLAELETEAMAMVENAPAGELAAVRARAVGILHDQGYLKAAADIQVPVGHFERILNQRLNEVRQRALGLARSVQGFLVILTAVTAVSILWATFWLRRRVMGTLGRVSEDLSSGTRQVDASSTALTATSGELSRGAVNNAASLEETSAALEELSSMTKQNAGNAEKANRLMGQSIDAFRRTDSAMDSLTQAMDEITVSGQEIGKIIKTIDEIAFQTNLLALNAAVEAARAGEAGVGFAVVADEVRNLALRSAEAAQSTTELIGSTTASINTGSQLLETVSGSIRTLAGQAQDVAQLIETVAEASREQSAGIDQISRAMNEVDRLTQTTAAAARQSAGEAGGLSEQAGLLLAVVDDLAGLVNGRANGVQPGPADHNGRPPVVH